MTSIYPCHVADPKYPINNILIYVSRNKFHLDWPITARCLLWPVLHTKLIITKGKQTQIRREKRRNAKHQFSQKILECSFLLKDTLNTLCIKHKILMTNTEEIILLIPSPSFANYCSHLYFTSLNSCLMMGIIIRAGQTIY